MLSLKSIPCGSLVVSSCIRKFLSASVVENLLMRPTQIRGRLTSQSRFVSRTPRRGAIILLAAVLMVATLAMLALSIDSGYMYTMQTQLDRSVDAAALAGAAALIEGTDQAQESVIEYLVRNPVGQPASILTDNELVELTAKFAADHAHDYEILWGNWNPDTGKLEETSTLPSAVSVTMTYPNLPFFFGRALGQTSFDVQSQAIAMYQPRDIMIVLDFSGSMNDDSELKSIGKFGKETIMNGLNVIYKELDSPEYGEMDFDPQYAVIKGVPPANGDLPQIDVEYRYTKIKVTSTKPLTNVIVKYSNGSKTEYNNLNGNSGEFGNGRAIYYVWVKSGPNGADPDSKYGEYFDLDSGSIRAKIKTALGLNNVDYPYESGSWNSFIDYCRSNSNNKNAGFRYMFGYANLINYWLEQKRCHHETADLWKVSAQPVTAVKDAVDVFMDYVTEVETNDRVGLAIYDAPDGNGKLEAGLTTDFEHIVDLTRHRQAGHYHTMTNIGAGMETARLELQQNGRQNAFKMIVLMTDGVANWHNGRNDVSGAKNHVAAESAAAKELNYPVVAISLGAGADTDLMNSVADITESRHFNIPGGQSVADYRDGLFEVFRAIANARPLKLVQ
jgi:Flp pilus assembly protein TadG